MENSFNTIIGKYFLQQYCCWNKRRVSACKAICGVVQSTVPLLHELFFTANVYGARFARYVACHAASTTKNSFIYFWVFIGLLGESVAGTLFLLLKGITSSQWQHLYSQRHWQHLNHQAMKAQEELPEMFLVLDSFQSSKEAGLKTNLGWSKSF